MSSEMIERVAKVICKSSGHDPDYVWSDGKPYWDMYEGSARAAIEAMREPTDDMSLRGGIGSPRLSDCPDSGDYMELGERCWQAMIDAALKEPEKG